MLKENSGVTLLLLVVTIIVLGILASITIYSGKSTIKQSKYYDAIHQMKVMQSKVNEWYEDKKNGDETSWDKGETSIETTGKLEECNIAYNSVRDNNLTDSNIGEFSKFRYFSNECIKNDLDIDGIKYDFLINIESRSVILVEGIELDGVYYYSLNEIEDEQYNVDYTE